MAESAVFTAMAWLAEFIHVGTAMVLFGSALFPFYTGRPAWPQKNARLIVVGIATLMVISIAVLTASILMNLTGQISSVANIAEWRDFFFDTSLGLVWLGRIVVSCAVLGGVLLLTRFRSGDPPGNMANVILALTSGLALSLIAVAGHAGAALAGPQASLAIGGQAIHLFGAAVWLGGLPALLLHSPRANGRIPTPGRTAPANTFYEVTAEFSFIAQIAVAVLFMGGALTLLILLDAWKMSVFSMSLAGYGGALAVKLSLLAIMLAIAGFNRLVLLERIRAADPRAAKHFRVMILLECALGAAVVFAAAGMGRLPPPV